MNCPKCNISVADDATFCNSCGYKLSGDGQVLSTNAVLSIQDQSTKLFNRVTYSTLTKVLFFSTLIAILGTIVSMFAVAKAAYVFVIPAIVMLGSILGRALKKFVDINSVSYESFTEEVRLQFTFIA